MIDINKILDVRDALKEHAESELMQEAANAIDDLIGELPEQECESCKISFEDSGNESDSN